MLISGKSSLKSPVITGEGEQAAGIVFDVGCLGISKSLNVATVIIYHELARRTPNFPSLYSCTCPCRAAARHGGWLCQTGSLVACLKRGFSCKKDKVPKRRKMAVKKCPF